MNRSYLIRAAQPSDLDRITEIYNQAVLTSTATFDTETQSLQDRTRWFETLQKGELSYPVLVALAKPSGPVVAYASLSPYSPKKGYLRTAEVSLYLEKDHRGAGLGSFLLEKLLAAGEAAGLHCALARITQGNEQSERIHTRLGFERVGLLKQVGFKFNQFLDVVLMQKILQQKNQHELTTGFEFNYDASSNLVRGSRDPR